MKLEVNKNHKKANIDIKSKIKPISLSLLGITLSISLLTGCYGHVDNNGFYINTDYATISNNYYNALYKINNEYDIERVIEDIENNSNLKYLSLSSTLGDIEIFNEDNFGILRDYDIRELILKDVNFNPTFLESLGSIERLEINDYNVKNLYVDYSKIDNLKELDFSGSNLGVYDYPIFLTNDLINKLKEKNVKINLGSVNLNDVISMNNALDDIVNNFNLNENTFVLDKLDTILVYILENFEYDCVVANNSANGINNPFLVKSFYKRGLLDAVYNKHGNIICGNYSALFQALANRVGLTSYYMESTNHAWNMVCFGSDKYYVDSTWLDTGEVYVNEELIKINRISTPEELIKNGNGSTLVWYMHDVYNIGSDSSHNAKYIPSNNYEYVEYIDSTEQTTTNNTNNNIDLNDYLYEIIINNEKFIANATTILGILISLGIAKKVISKHKRRRNHYYRKKR